MKQLVGLLILATLYTSCKKDDDTAQNGYHCSLDSYKIGGSLAFVGVSLAEMDTIYVAQYKANTGFSVLQTRDTFVFNLANQNTVTLKNDSIYLTSTPARQPKITDTADYRIFLPGTNTEYSFTHIGYLPFTDTYYSATPCKGGIRQPHSPDSAWIDDQLTYADTRSYPLKAFFLRRK